MTEPPTQCPFCSIITGTGPAAIVREWGDAIAIVPLNPVVEGHLLVIPRAHVADFTAEPQVSAAVMRRAAELAAESGQPMNLITSRGREATQSVWHLHLHLVPRRAGDTLALPWDPRGEEPDGAAVLRAEVARLHEGEDTTPRASGCEPTPGQWLHRFNNAAPEQRLVWAADVLQHARDSSRCLVELRHDDEISDLRSRVDELQGADMCNRLHQTSGDESDG